jgi:hypothetical protein
MKKIIFLTTLCLSLTTGAAFAQSFGGGRGTESDPVRISSRAHLEELATSVNGGATYEGYHFKLTANLTGVTTIIGNTNAFFFSGNFDGDGHTIELNINTTGNYAGIFGNLRGATVKNMNVSGRVVLASSSSSYSYAGGICGNATNSTVSNCHNTGSISSSSSSHSYAGGICGYGGTINNCYNTGNISSSSSSSSSSSYAGGICGSGGTINNCYNTGNISSSSSSHSYAGGICGSGGTINNCFAANATITASNSSEAGRIVGDRGSISNCHALMSMKINGQERRSMNANSKDGADSENADFKNESWLASSLKWNFNTVWTMGRNGWPALKSVDGPTGNGSPERALPEVVLYPNPATHDVYIRSDRPFSKVEIYNSAGLCVWRTDNFTDKADVSGLERGVYVMRIYTTPSPQAKLLMIRK